MCEGKKEKTVSENKFDSNMASKYRAIVARANYLQTDRPDMSFATKEFASGMPEPTMDDWNQIRENGQIFEAGAQDEAMVRIPRKPSGHYRNGGHRLGGLQEDTPECDRRTLNGRWPRI